MDHRLTAATRDEYPSSATIRLPGDRREAGERFPPVRFLWLSCHAQSVDCARLRVFDVDRSARETLNRHFAESQGAEFRDK